MDNFEKYKTLAEHGATHNEIFLTAKADGLAASLSEHQARFIPALEEALWEMEDEEKGNLDH